MKILITGGNSAIALKLLKAFTQHQVLLADYGDIPALNSQNYELKSLGLKNEDITAHHLLSFCLDYEIAAILPLRQFEINTVLKSKTLFNEFNIQVILPAENDIKKYTTNTKSNDWLVLVNGELVYTSFNPLPVEINAHSENLSGAFYYLTSNKLGLITTKV